ncbi:unnamed protein product, partial [Rotaria sordida]
GTANNNSKDDKEFGGLKRINNDTRNFIKTKYKFHLCANSTTTSASTASTATTTSTTSATNSTR